jgi:hypothetical protein
MVFDNNLHYQEDIYRTPTMRCIFTHNTPLMKKKGCLIYEKNGMIAKSSRPVESKGLQSNTLIPTIDVYR